MAIITDYDKVIKEYMDLTDRNTRKTLISLDEADQNQLLVALTSKLYDKIVEKVDDIDFGTIPRSRGDITKIENYSSLMECVDILRSIVVEYRENTYPVDVVSSAVENLKLRKNLFTKAYVLDVKMPIILYNTVTLAIVSSVSFLISGCIEYVKDPGSETFSIALDKVGYNKTAHNLLFENLEAFNSACKKGDIDLAIQDVIRNNRKLAEAGYFDEEHYDDTPEEDKDKDTINDNTEKLNELDVSSIVSTIGGGVSAVTKSLIAICKCIIPFIQNLVYYFYQSKQNISDYFAIQAELVQMNAYKVQYNSDLDVNKRKNIYNRQMKIANNMKNISNKFAIDYSKSAKNSASMIDDEKKKFKTSDLGIQPPIDSGSGSALF